MYFQSGYFSEIDRKRAIELAEGWLNGCDNERKKNLEEFLINLFNLWKYEKGQKRMYFLGILNGNKKYKVSEVDRLCYIEENDAWNCAPEYVNSNPIDLLIHIWVSDYKDFIAEREAYNNVIKVDFKNGVIL